MGTIIERSRKDGSKAFTAQIVIKKDGTIVRREAEIAIVKSMPRVKPEIFPYSTDAISAAFTRACKILGIEDLRFHDLRHEGISRLFEMGRTIPQVAAVSGHRSWTSLKRYTHIQQSKDKYDLWKWKVNLEIG